MILDFKFLKYSVDTDSYRSINVSLFNTKEIELIKNINVVEDVVSGDVVYKDWGFHSSLDINQRDLKDHYVNLMANHGIVLANAKTPEKCTLFIENMSIMSAFGTLQHIVKESYLTEQVVYRKISVDSFRKRVREERDFVINVDGVDYAGIDTSLFESRFSENNYFYIIKDDDVNGISFDKETLVKAFQTDQKNTFPYLPTLLQTISKSAYDAKLISAKSFIRSVKRLKREITYDEYIQMKSLIGTDYEYTLLSLLGKYDFSFIVNENYHNDPVSYIYMKILNKKHVTSDAKLEEAINSAYIKHEYNIIHEYLREINLSESKKPDIMITDEVVFKPVFYYTWDKPNDVFKDLNFKEYNEQESIE